MTSSVRFVDAWIHELVEPGSVLLLNSATDETRGRASFCALLNCPNCGRLEVLTEEQFAGKQPVICGGSDCWAQFLLRDGQPELTGMGES